MASFGAFWELILLQLNITIYPTFFTFTYRSSWVSSVYGSVSAGGSSSRHLCVEKWGGAFEWLSRPEIWGTCFSCSLCGYATRRAKQNAYGCFAAPLLSIHVMLCWCDRAKMVYSLWRQICQRRRCFKVMIHKVVSQDVIGDFLQLNAEISQNRAPNSVDWFYFLVDVSVEATITSFVQQVLIIAVVTLC